MMDLFLWWYSHSNYFFEMLVMASFFAIVLAKQTYRIQCDKVTIKNYEKIINQYQSKGRDIGGGVANVQRTNLERVGL